jgi:hypothetical protein
MSDDPRIPSFLAPLWRRVAVVVIVGVWSAVELALGNVLWGALFAAVAAWALWDLILRPMRAAGK